MHSSSALPNIRYAPYEIRKPYDFMIGRCEGDSKAAPNDIIGPLIREFYALKYCTGGKGTIIVNDKSFSVSAGQCYIALAGDVVTEIADSDDPWSHVWVVFIGYRAGVFFQQFGITSESPLFPWKENATFLSLLKDTICACEDSSNASEAKKIAYAFLILDALYEYFGDYNAKPSTLAEQYVHDALSYIEGHLTQNITVSDIASHLGLNRSYFSSLFHQQMQVTPQDYLVRFRISRACELFAFPNATVTSVANALNYEPSVFFRHFKRIIGISPSEYKKRLNNVR